MRTPKPKQKYARHKWAYYVTNGVTKMGPFLNQPAAKRAMLEMNVSGTVVREPKPKSFHETPHHQAKA